MHVRVDEGRSDQCTAQFDHFVGIAETRATGGVIPGPGHYPIHDGQRGGPSDRRDASAQ
jgi:hypothetical protein